MPSVALSGNDTCQINLTVLADFADDTPVELTFPNEIASVKTGKNGNSIYGLNESGRQAEVTIRVLRGSSDDKTLNALMINQQGDFAGFTLLTGQFTKKIGDGKGVVASDTYVLSGGVFVKQIPGKMNVAGDTEQSVATYVIRFSNAPRAIT